MNKTNDDEVLYGVNCPHCNKYICFNGADNYDNPIWNDEIIGEIKIHKRSQTHNNRGYYEYIIAEMKCHHCTRDFKEKMHFGFNV